MAERNASDEIDLGFFFQSINRFFKRLLKLFFLVFAFFIKHFLVIVILIIVGIIAGYFLDKSKDPVFTNELIVIPNFESSDYLYQEIENFEFKKRAKDTLFLHSILGKEFKNLIKVEIEPINDIYSFAAEKREYLETLRILYNTPKNQEEIITNRNISKHFKYHRLTITTKGKNSQEICDMLLKYLNSNEHFKNYQAITIKDTEVQIFQNERMLSQIDSILKFTSENIDPKQSPSVYINTQNDLFQLVNSKQQILEKRLDLQKKLIDQDQIIKLVSGSYNLDKGGILALPNKIVIPLYLVLLFSGVYFILFVYKRLKILAEERY